ncbi:MAG: endonuclease [Actinomycetia bacterium]|nr:endonuclease [Actinomycetes bacterium]
MSYPKGRIEHMFVDERTIPLEQLEHQITTLAGQLAATTCRWLHLVAEFDTREGWKEWGCRSAAHWLSWKCGVSLRTGREHVRVAHALESLPLTTEAFERGELSYSKVKALTRIASPENEGELVPFARTATAAQLDRTIHAYLASTRAADARLQEAKLTSSLDAEGMGVLRVLLPPEQLAVVDAAIEEALKVTPTKECGPAGPHSIAERRAAALVTICESFLAHGAEVRQGPERTLVVLHVDADGVTAPELDNGTALHPETARRLGCDASVVSMIEQDGNPIGVGRQTRVPNRAARRATKARDRHCRWPGCDERRFVEAHHRVHWADGGVTDLDNLVLLCWFHHQFLHEGGFTIDEHHQVFRPDGTQLLVGEPVAVEPLDPEVTADAIIAKWAGERLDLDLAVTALWGLVE